MKKKKMEKKKVSNWLNRIQGDTVLHECYLTTTRLAMTSSQGKLEIELRSWFLG